MLVYIMVLAIGAVFAALMSYNWQEQMMDLPTAINLMLLVLSAMVMFGMLPMGTLLIIAAGYLLLLWGGPRE